MEKRKKEACYLCPRRCGVDRSGGELGICGQSDTVKAARAALHMWEEPCISGSSGSGTVFFSGCSLHCVFCQNHSIANGEIGNKITIKQLSDIFLDLQTKGANNINLVTGAHFVPQIIRALDSARARGLVLPIVYNSSGYESVETIRMLDGYVDVYLPDLKYVDSGVSQRYSHAADYFVQASAAIREMVRQTGTPRFVKEGVLRESREKREALWKNTSLQMNAYEAEQQEDCGEVAHATKQFRVNCEEQAEAMTQFRANCEGQAEEMAYFREKSVELADENITDERDQNIILVRGTIVRHLQLPQNLDNSKQVVKYLIDSYGDSIYISLMSQYTPVREVEGMPELSERVSEVEYEELIQYAIDKGIAFGFVQEGDVAEESFIPKFDLTGIVTRP